MVDDPGRQRDVRRGDVARGGARRRGRACFLVAIALVASASCRGRRNDDVEMRVRNVGFDHTTGSPVVILESSASERLLPIWVGAGEAQSIALEMQKVHLARPLTHDLVKRILDGTGVALRRVRITTLEARTFFATLVLEQAGREIEVDSRPSDAIALALRAPCPILVSRTLLESDAAMSLRDADAPGVAKLWGITVQDLEPSLAESLGAGGVRGVLVSDVGPAGAAGLRRGDVIVRVDGVAVADVAAVRALETRDVDAHRLDVRRGGTRVTVEIAPPRG